MSIFYCPKCDTLTNKMNLKDYKVVWSNPRDGYGRPISHIICPLCEYELAGYMSYSDMLEDGKYVKSTIKMYSDYVY